MSLHARRSSRLGSASTRRMQILASRRITRPFAVDNYHNSSRSAKHRTSSPSLCRQLRWLASESRDWCAPPPPGDCLRDSSAAASHRAFVPLRKASSRASDFVAITCSTAASASHARHQARPCTQGVRKTLPSPRLLWWRLFLTTVIGSLEDQLLSKLALESDQRQADPPSPSHQRSH